MQRYHTNIINLHNRGRLKDQKLKPQIRAIRHSRERNQIILENARRLLIASIHSVHRLTVDHNAHESFRLRAFVEIGPESQIVWHTGNGSQVLTEGCRGEVCVWGDRSGLIELIGKFGVVARRAEFVSVAGEVCGDPRGQAAFEVTVGDGVVVVGVWCARRRWCSRC